jgi:hypothetical protein
MTRSRENFAELADAARAAAADQVLGNVRQKHLTAAATWDALALDERKIDALRLRRLLEREHFPVTRTESDDG